MYNSFQIKTRSISKELKKNDIPSYKANKGDFSVSSNCKFIISIGFQGAAIEVRLLNKPIIFFTSNKTYFDEFVFSNEFITNKKIINVFNRLILSSSEIEMLISSELIIAQKIEELQSSTNEFFELIGITNNEPYVLNYLANLCN